MRRILSSLCLTALLVTPGICLAGEFTYSAGTAAGFPGDSVTVNIQMDNASPARGFSVGLGHDGALLSVSGISQGAAVSASNGGAGADFFFTDSAPVGGSGCVIGCVLSLDAPIEDIPTGSNLLVAIDFDIAAGAAAGSVANLTFVDTLGNPPVENVISVAGNTEVPTLMNGMVTVLTFPVTGLSCSITDPCTCDYSMSWTNGASYDSITILEDGNLVTTLAGTATSFNGTLASNGTSTLSVIGSAGGIDSTATTCTVDCPVINPPAAPTGLDCTVDNNTGIATLTWTNNAIYNFVDVFVDGALDSSVAGTATTAMVTLPAFGTYELCIGGTGQCDLSFPQVCCTVDYQDPNPLPDFIRGDASGDGVFNGLSDAIVMLSFQFSGGPAPACMESADANNDGLFNGLTDALWVLNHAFTGGPPPAAPYPACGVDPEPGTSLGCGVNACP